MDIWRHGFFYEMKPRLHGFFYEMKPRLYGFFYEMKPRIWKLSYLLTRQPQIIPGVIVDP